MKKSSKRTLSRLLAGIMLFTSIMGSTVVSGAEGDVAVSEDTVVTEGSADDVVTSGNVLWLDDIATSGDAWTVEPGLYDLTDDDGTEIGSIELIGQGENKFTVFASDIARGDREGLNAYKAGSRDNTIARDNQFAYIPQQGAGCAVLFRPVVDGMFNAYIYTTTGALRVWEVDGQYDVDSDGNGIKEATANYTVTSETGAENYAFAATAGNVYILSTTSSTNNFAYCGFEFIPDEPATVGVSLNNVDAAAESIPSLEITFTDTALGTAQATIPSDATSVDLMAGHTYQLSTNDGGVEALINGESTFVAEDGSSVTIDLYNIPDVELTGEITGTPEGTVTALSFTNMVNGTVAEAEITGNTYEVWLKPGDYNTSVVTTNGGVTYDRVAVLEEGENVNEVYVEIPQLTGTFTYDQLPQFVTEGTGTARPNNGDFTAKPGTVLTIPVSGVTTINVNSYYQSDFTINGAAGAVVGGSTSDSTSQIDTATYTTDGTETSVTITFGEGYATSYLTSIEILVPSEFKSEISVPGDYDTLKDAVAAIKAMERPAGEAGRVTINLTADIQEQIVFDAPYITLNGNGHEINWYYGIGTFYYSIDESTGLYSERLFRDKYSSAEADSNLWGGVAIIRGDNFIAHDTTFRNTYNYWVTEKEVDDVEHTSGGMPQRVLGADVTVKAAKERSNAFYIEADNIEVYNCQILSSQDTLGRNGSANNGYHVYFKDCVIGGNTDYICGEFTAIFDNCELQWKTYANDASSNGEVGYITAPKTSPYIFRNCTVTTDGVGPVEEVKGLYGRTWGANSYAAFIDTETNGLISETGWGEMSTGELQTAKFEESGNLLNGAEFTTTVGTALSEADRAVMTSDSALIKYMAAWIPSTYEYTSTVGLWGDVDLSSIITANDAAATLSYTLDPSIADRGVFDFFAANVSGDANVTAADASMILQKVLDAEFRFPVEEPSEPAGTVYIVGDSTACHYAETADATDYYKRVGFGDKLGDYINAEVVNLALSGRSSKSYLADPEYQTLLSSMKEGDYLIIAFGHNDEKTDTDRFTAPGGTKEEAGTFKNSLYTNYILKAQEVGATPILATPIVRRTATADTWSDNCLHIANGGDYAQDIRDLGAELGITVIDNLTLTKNLYDELTPSETQYLHRWYRAQSVDNTHLNNYGAKYVAYLMAEAIKASDSTLAPYVKADNVAPTKDDLIVNPDWTAPEEGDITGEDLISAVWATDTANEWYGTVMGDMGGLSKLFVCNTDGTPVEPLTLVKTGNNTNFNVSENADGTVNVRCGIAKNDISLAEVPTSDSTFGKIATASDGWAMYYKPVDASADFTISGTITLNGYQEKNNQVAFGAIVADKVMVDTYDASAVDNYVAASGLKFADIGKEIKDAVTGEVTGYDTGWAGYARIAGTLTEYKDNGGLTAAPVVGESVDVSITKQGDVYTVVYGDKTSTFTVPMEGTIYAGFYAARCANITVSNIVFNNEIVE